MINDLRHLLRDLMHIARTAKFMLLIDLLEQFKNINKSESLNSVSN